MVERSNHMLARRVAITSTSLPTLVRIAELFGGKIHTHTTPTGRNRQQFQWYVYGDGLRRILTGALPYLVGKQDEAETCLAFDRPIRPSQSHRLTPSDQATRTALLTHVQQLRRRTWTATDVPTAFTSRVQVG